MTDHSEPESRRNDEDGGDEGVGARGIEDVPGNPHHHELERLRAQTSFTLADAARISHLLNR